MNIPLPRQNSDGSYTTGPCGMSIDGDGANGQSSAPVYAPAGFRPAPLDYLANAGHPGNWYGVVTDGEGNPIVQGEGDPMPGAYVSATSYKHRHLARTNPRAYVDSNAVLYFVLPSHWRVLVGPVVLGCRGVIYDTKTDTTVEAGILDFGPKSHLGEASIAAANAFGVPSSPKNGGTDERRFIYTFWAGEPFSGYELQPA